MFINFITKNYHRYSLLTNIIQRHDYLDTTLMKTKEKEKTFINKQ